LSIVSKEDLSARVEKLWSFLKIQCRNLSIPHWLLQPNLINNACLWLLIRRMLLSLFKSLHVHACSDMWNLMICFQSPLLLMVSCKHYFFSYNCDNVNVKFNHLLHNLTCLCHNAVLFCVPFMCFCILCNASSANKSNQDMLSWRFCPLFSRNVLIL
jgi:hypothetical protein